MSIGRYFFILASAIASNDLNVIRAVFSRDFVTLQDRKLIQRGERIEQDIRWMRQWLLTVDFTCFLNFVLIQQHVRYTVVNRKFSSWLWTEQIAIYNFDFQQHVVNLLQKILVRLKILYQRLWQFADVTDLQ